MAVEVRQVVETRGSGSNDDRLASPYATGGGGFALEHQFGALALTHLLTGDPIPELGDDATLTLVSFQAAYESPVDDLVLHGLCGDGGERRVAVAVRRTPRLVPSDSRSVDLFASFLGFAEQHWEDLESGHWRLAVVGVPGEPLRQLASLAAIACAEPDNRAFREAVGRAGRTREPVRQRLAQVDRIGSVAAEQLGIAADSVDDLTWRILSSLTVRAVRLETEDDSDRSTVVAGLRRVTADESVSNAAQLFDSLAQKASRYALHAARVNEAMLRRDLAGTAQLLRSPRHLEGWAVLDRLSDRLHQRVRSDLRGKQGQRLRIDREDARAALALAIEAVGPKNPDGAYGLVVTGEPDVGKSSLTLEAATQAAESDLAVVAINLRDLPPSTVELEHILGAPVAEVLGGAVVRSSRVLLVDGAEAALEGRDKLLQDVVSAAIEVGLGVVAVTRVDGERAVVGALQKASEVGSDTPVQPDRHLVEELRPDEIVQVVGAFSALDRIAEDPRSRWLLGRLGLVELLLKTSMDYQFSEGALSEADVYAAVWSSLVRRGETTPVLGASPDEREEALLELARQQLVPGSRGSSAYAGALSSLRSDGLLLPAEPTSAWLSGDQFASDLIRDFALVRLFLREGYEQFQEFGAPRWALRAALLACMSTIAAAGEASEQARTDQQSRFRGIAASEGERWAELPLEATLLLEDALARAWPTLSERDPQSLRTLIRIARQRYVSAGIAQSAALRPLMTLICRNWDQLQESVGYEIAKQIRGLTLEWLRGLLLYSEEANALRAELRVALLTQDPEPHDEFAVQALALLGPDLDETVEQRLRSMATDSPGLLAPAVEPGFAVLSLVRRNPELLALLTEAYYIVLPDENDPWQQDSLLFEEGIRSHQNHDHSFLDPLANWRYGPFTHLLSAAPAAGIRTINHILNHAAHTRVKLVERHPDPVAGSDETMIVRGLDLPGIGQRACIGDSHVWRWYRGSSNGPAPCVSALLAVERFADDLLGAGLKLQEVSDFLLRDCHNVAMPGLVVGLLIRHLDVVGDELDVWISQPDVWNLEFDRIANEGRLHIQGPEADDAALIEARRKTLGDVVASQMTTSLVKNEQERVESLIECGRRLMQNARRSVPGLDPSDGSSDYRVGSLITVASWASAFEPDNYAFDQLPDGRIAFQVQLPKELATAKEPRDRKMQQVEKHLHLLYTYGYSENRHSESETLREDLSHGRSVLENPPDDTPDMLVGPAAVAASAILAHRDGRLQLDSGEAGWASMLLLACAARQSEEWFAVEESMYIMGPDRSAAAAMPSLLLLSAKGTPGIPARRRVSDGLRACLTSSFLEVQGVAAEALKEVWQAECARAGVMRTCFHRVALQAVEIGLRGCGQGPRGKVGRRPALKLRGRLLNALHRLSADAVNVSRLSAPLLALSDAASSNCCIAGDAKRILLVLLDAHTRAALLQDRRYFLRPSLKGHMHNAARAMFSLAASGDSEPLVKQLGAFTRNTAALQNLLQSLLEVATYEQPMRVKLPVVWPRVMITVLDALDAGADLGSDHFHTERALAHLIPHPQVAASDMRMDLTERSATEEWIDPASISALVERWLAHAHGWPLCVDAAVKLIGTGEADWQATSGLGWIDSLTADAGNRLANQCWHLVDWLQEVSSVDRIQPEARVTVRRIVDDLSSHGDSRAVRMQRGQEQTESSE